MQKFRDFIKKIDPKEKIAIIHDRDTDGVCSGIIVIRALEKLQLPVAFRFNQEFSEKSITQAMVDKLKKLEVTTVITTDLAVDQNVETVKELEKFSKILVLDHHKPTVEISSDKTTMIRGQDLFGKYCPTSILAFKLFSEITDIQSSDWLASIGIVADGGYEQWKEFVEETAKSWKMKFEDFKKMSDIVGAIALHDDDKLVEEIFWRLQLISIPKEFLEENYEKYIKDIDDEVDLWFNKHEENAKFFGEYVYYSIKPRYTVKSPLSTKLWDIYPDKTIIIIEDRGKNFIDISLRRKDGKQDTVSLFTELIKDLPEASGGGHAVASGGKIRRESLKEFEKRLFQEVSK